MPCAAAMPATEASCVGDVVTAIAFTPARLNAATWPDMSSSVALIFCSTTFMSFSDAKYFDPLSPFSPYSPSKYRCPIASPDLIFPSSLR